MFMMRFDMRAPDPTRTTDLYAAAIDMAEWAETRGCVMIALSEHHASPDGFLPSPLVLASAMAARTKQVALFVAPPRCCRCTTRSGSRRTSRSSTTSATAACRTCSASGTGPRSSRSTASR